LRIYVFIALALLSLTCGAYLDRSGVFALDAGMGSSLDVFGRVFGEAYRQEWAFHGSLSYGLNEHFSLSARATSLAQKPKDEVVLKLQQGRDQGDLNPDLDFDPDYNQMDYSLAAKYHFNVGGIYAPLVELGGGYSNIYFKGENISKPFACAGLGHEFFIRPNLALEILGDGHIFFFQVKPLLMDKSHNLFLLGATIAMRWYL